jgi:hypothetical protein
VLGLRQGALKHHACIFKLMLTHRCFCLLKVLRNVVGCCVATRFRELHKFNIRRCAGVGVMGQVLSTRLVAINVPWVVTRATKSFASHASLAIVQSSACPRCTASIMVTICELRLTSFSRRSMRLSRPTVAGKEPVAMTCHRYEGNAAREKNEAVFVAHDARDESSRATKGRRCRLN